MVDVDRSQADGRQTIYGAAVGFRMLEARNLTRGALSWRAKCLLSGWRPLSCGGRRSEVGCFTCDPRREPGGGLTERGYSPLALH